MMIEKKSYLGMGIKEGCIREILSSREDLAELVVEVEEELCKAIAYTLFTQNVRIGDRVLLNTTAVDLKLGSGGRHFVVANLSRVERQTDLGPGHIMKLRYTPLQFKINCLEEEFFGDLACADSIQGMPVLVLELHSMVLPAVLALRKKSPCRIVYIMTDGGSLPLALSNQVSFLKGQGFIDYTITAGHAFGGDLEAINVYTALLGAKHILKADVAVLAMGPGVVGTGSRFGFSGIEQGENINRINVLEGKPIASVRMSFADTRERHRGVSHHSITNLKNVAVTPAYMALPVLEEEMKRVILAQFAENGLPGIHRMSWHPTEEALLEIMKLSFKAKTMGRTVEEDTVFFAAAAATGEAAYLHLH